MQRDIAFHAYMQFLADRGWAAAQAEAKAAGMGVGLISDLAVGTDGGGSHAWSRQDEMLIGLSIGAPPDLLNTQGQNWGITAFSPRGLQLHGFRRVHRDAARRVAPRRRRADRSCDGTATALGRPGRRLRQRGRLPQLPPAGPTAPDRAGITSCSRRSCWAKTSARFRRVSRRQLIGRARSACACLWFEQEKDNSFQPAVSWSRRRWR